MKFFIQILLIPIFAIGQSLKSNMISVPDSGSYSIKSDKNNWRLHKAGVNEDVFRAKGRMIIVQRTDPQTLQLQGKIESKRFKKIKQITTNIHVANFDEDSVGFEGLKAELSKNPNVESIEPDLRIRSSQFLDPKPKKAIDLDFTSVQQRRSIIRRSLKVGSKKVRVGILDTGIDFLHPDLDTAVEQGVNLIYTSTITDSLDFEALDSTEMDYNGHGTEVAGIIGALKNEFGIDGISKAKLVGMKAFNKNGDARLSDVIAGIQWAMKNNIDVLNMSCGTYEYSAAFEKTVSAAIKSGMIIVAAAGNDHSKVLAYPANFSSTLAIGSENEEGHMSEFSNFGSRVDFFAPGEKILSTGLSKSGSPYQIFSGTSAACAHVSGLIALGISEGLSKQSAISLIKKTSEKRMDFLSSVDTDFVSVHQDAFVDNLEKEAVSRMTLTGFGANRRIWKVGSSISLTYKFQNTGTLPTEAVSLFGIILVGDTSKTFDITPLPILKPGESISQHLILPDWVTESPKLVTISLSLKNTSNVIVEGTQKNVQIGIVSSDQSLIQPTAIWLDNLEPGTSSNRKMIVQVINAGNSKSKEVELFPEMQPGGHCSIDKVASTPIGSSIKVGAIEPGKSKSIEVNVPDLDIPISGSFTVFALFKNGNDTLGRFKKQLQPFKKGFLRPLYAQVVHRWIATEAVKLLKLKGIYIPDLMAPNSQYLGDGSNYSSLGFDIGGNGVSYRIAQQPPSSSPYWTEDFIVNKLMFPKVSLVHGANDCDEIDVAFNLEGFDLYDSHFWLVDQDDLTGHTFGAVLSEHHPSALKKIQALMFGQSYVSNSFLQHGAIEHYKLGYKKSGWWLLGHAVHLIGDLSVPSHIDDANWHGVWGDGYHDWVDAGNYPNFAGAQKAIDKFGGMINPYQSAALNDPVRFLAYTTAQVGNAYPFGNDGRNKYRFGKYGNRVAGGTFPHYDNYLNDIFNKMITSNREIGLPDVHPLSADEINQDEVDNSRGWYTTCNWQSWFGGGGAPYYEWYADCMDGNGHVDYNNTFDPGGWGHSQNDDRDLEAIARINLNYAIASAAGLIYYYAKETGQLNYRVLPAINSLLLN